MKTTLNLKNIPLLHEDECDRFFHPDHIWGNMYFTQFSYMWLPVNDEESTLNGLFDGVKEGSYLVGMEVISETDACAGFCGWVYNTLGLVLDYSATMLQHDYSQKKALMRLRFKHVFMKTHNNNDFTVVP